MDVVECDDQNVNGSLDAQLFPSFCCQLGAPLLAKDANEGHRDGEDCGRRARPCSRDAESSGKKRREPRPGT